MNQVTDTVKHLIIINALFFLGVKSLGGNLFDLLALWFPESPNFEVWQIFTHMFMHHQTFYLHILSNMLALWMFGTPLEQMWGRNKFLFFYFSAGLGAVILPFAIDYYQLNSLIQNLVNSGIDKDLITSTIREGKIYPVWEEILGKTKFNDLIKIVAGSSVGASGAVMGLLAGFGINYPNTKLSLIFLPIPIAAKFFIPLLLTYEALSGIFNWSSIFGINVAHFAHIGGALTGALMAWYWKRK